jgi:hypothetical protein
MTFQQKIKKVIGNEIYKKLENEANNEVSLALKMPLKDKNGQDNYYRQRFILPLLLSECDLFERKGLKISPIDLINVLFKCKMIFAVNIENEYRRRVGGGSYISENDFVVPWNKKSQGIDALIDEYLDRLETFQSNRTLLVNINSFNDDSSNSQGFIDQLFQKLNFPFVAFIEESQLIEKLKKIKPSQRKYELEDAKNFFYAPSIGFTIIGSSNYCRWYSSAWLRTFLCLLKIAGFLYPGQIDFGHSGIEIIAPTIPVFMDTPERGGYSWEEDKKEPWLKIPDGCLWRSFGYRGISILFIDIRTFKGIENFLIEHKQIFDLLKNPWDKRCLTQIAPTLDILSSATQIPDLGAKVLLIYCCLEHLFMPENVSTDNKKYIIGGINALNSSLLEWFNRLYKLRCDYAHKGFIKRDEKALGLIMESIRNVMTLLKIKLYSSKII